MSKMSKNYNLDELDFPINNNKSSLISYFCKNGNYTVIEGSNGVIAIDIDNELIVITSNRYASLSDVMDGYVLYTKEIDDDKAPQGFNVYYGVIDFTTKEEIGKECLMELFAYTDVENQNDSLLIKAIVNDKIEEYIRENTKKHFLDKK